ncbi:hypothetical protein LUZ60_007427 [Juncus effusus]|nr:hypothetical protein LUZ60_007427 [Juncus effusus]
MAKGDDIIRKKKNDKLRKRLRRSENAVSDRVAAIIASKRRRKNGKRRICEGMCYSLPTVDDPFNDRQGKKKEPEKKTPKKENKNPSEKQKVESKVINGDERNSPSKFLMVCLNAIKDSWREEETHDENSDNPFDINSWGLDLWRSFSTGTNVLDSSGTSGTNEQIAWLVSIASDNFARREKQGLVVSCPYLLYIVPTQDKAIQVRSICKPLKSVGIHSVSLHQGASIQHQVLGLKSCEPEFLISTPGRLLELISLKAIDISSVSLLVVDGLGQGDDAEIRYADKLNQIKENIPGEPHAIIFGDFYEKMRACVNNLLGKKINRLTINDSIESKSAFISQHLHLCTSHNEKIARVNKILAQLMCNDSKSSKILLITKGESKNQFNPSKLSMENCKIDNVSKSGSFTIRKKEEEIRVIVKDIESLKTDLIGSFETVVIFDFPSSIQKYEEILIGISRNSVSGKLHALLSESDLKFAESLIQLLARCQQAVPQFLQDA